jgi:sterol desaturase/sphingolipid hydroxylase (fatty acid hydroxylase superfamily)
LEAFVIGWIELCGLLSLPFFLLLDLVYRARRYTAPKRWRLRALLVTVVSVAIGMSAPVAWARIFGDFALLEGHRLGTWGGALLGVVVYELAHYAYHRAAHRWDWLWRLGHQMHHSAESIDAFGAYYLHPVDAFFFASWASIILVPLLGLSPEACVVAGAFLAFCAVFQHANIRTPHWLGFIVQRPESHAIHHARGVHAHNYSDLPLWDMVFGTFRNPERLEQGAQGGFVDGASSRVGDMLLLRDVSGDDRDDAPASLVDSVPSR